MPRQPAEIESNQAAQTVTEQGQPSQQPGVIVEQPAAQPIPVGEVVGESTGGTPIDPSEGVKVITDAPADAENEDDAPTVPPLRPGARLGPDSAIR